MFKKSGRGAKKSFCINETCTNFTPEEKRGGWRKPAAEGDTQNAAEGAEQEKVKTAKKSSTKKTAEKKPAVKKTAAKKETNAKKTVEETTESKSSAEKKSRKKVEK